VRAEEQGLPLRGRLETRVEVPDRRADNRAGAVLVDAQAAVVQVARDDVADLA